MQQERALAIGSLLDGEASDLALGRSAQTENFQGHAAALLAFLSEAGSVFGLGLVVRLLGILIPHPPSKGCGVGAW
jgi:hypothetical protein